MTSGDQTNGQADKLLWTLGGIVGVLAIGAFVLLNMGGSDTASTAGVTAPVAPVETGNDGAAVAADASAAGDDFTVLLNRARLAEEAGMLTEPEGYSAWSIYASILDADAGHAEAAARLAAVADAIADEAHAAFDSGRREEARSLAERVLSRFPEHEDANDVIARIDRSLTAPAAEPAAALPQRPAPVAAAATRAATPAPETASEPAAAPEPADAVAEIYTQFTRALAQGRLRPPAPDNAMEFLAELRTDAPDHPMATEAGQQLFDALLARHDEAFNDLNSTAAIEWLDLADALDVDAARVAAARERIVQFLADQSAQESIAASELTLRNYVAPVYPQVALRRELEGWVDVAFTVSRDGHPKNVEVIDSSHSLFRDAATRAVEDWEFEPYVVYDRVVEQHAHTRIRFVFQD